MKNNDELLEALGEVPSSGIKDVQEVERTAEGTFDAQQVQELAKYNMDFLAALAFPSIYEFAFPPLFLSAWQLLTTYVHKTRDFSKLALGLPRGFAKTTLIKLFLLYVILYTDRKFILVCSSTEKHAANIISDLMDMLDEPNIRAVFGDWRVAVESDTKTFVKFSYRGRSITIAAVGEGGSVRGFNVKNERPDVMVFDDIQKREEADNDQLAKALETWMYGTAMKAKSPKGCLYIFAANMYPTEWSLLRRIKKNPTWIKFIVGGILADGTSLWEELMPVAQLIQEWIADEAAGQGATFKAEVLNDEDASLNHLIDVSKIPQWPFEDTAPHQGNFVLIDPAGNNPNSDATSVGYFEVFDAMPGLRKLTEDRLSPMDTIKSALRYCLQTGCRLVVIEGNAYQASLAYWFGYVCAQMGIVGITCVPIFSGSRSKNSRIIEMFKSLLAGEILIHPEVRPAVTHQISNFKPLKTNNVDGILDLLHYSRRVLVEYSQYIAISDILVTQDIGGIQVLEADQNSPF